jgi:DNA-binding transcriptional MocR family regulator
MQPAGGAGDDGPISGELTLDAYADQLKRARQLSGLASLLPKGAMAAAGGSDASVAQTLKRQEDIVRCARSLRRCAAARYSAAVARLQRHARSADGPNPPSAILHLRSALTPEERLAPLSSLSAAAKSRIADTAGCSAREVGDALAKYEWTKAAMARMAAMKAAGQPMPTSFDELEARACCA